MTEYAVPAGAHHARPLTGEASTPTPDELRRHGLTRTTARALLPPTDAEPTERA